MFLNDDLDPTKISAELGLRPSQAWRKGEKMEIGSVTHTFEWGGWKRFTPPSLESKLLPQKLKYWCHLLHSRRNVLRKLNTKLSVCTLNCQVFSSSTVSIIISQDLQAQIASLGLELRLSFFADGASDANDG
jgi:hypothetical protein